ncbi:hypothetical protein NLI96_g10507 [Meripilus lineatus]|uniref:CxC2-like cysteine cluster KDZ transposase-associated domain-containing protein n=1 Tax=Meripilus lineatus TaxID=2056292 RepID=A0AAD5UTG5_9APHY|nr:hypothetical protein NLI96_g10507 [Physisporinus lineatus]
MGRRTKPRLFVPDQPSDSESSDSETPAPDVVQSTFIRHTTHRYRGRRNHVLKDSSPDLGEETTSGDDLEESIADESTIPTETTDDAAVVDPVEGSPEDIEPADVIPDDIEHHVCEPESEAPRWTGKYFWPTSLAALGLSVQLNHTNGSCPLPKPGPTRFVVMDVNGFHL